MATRLDPDQDLLTALREGEPTAAEALVTAYGDRAYRLAARITGNEQDAEEAVQDAFWSVVRKIDTFRGDSAFGSWVYRIVSFLLDFPRGRGRDHVEDRQKVMMTRTRTPQRFTKASLMAGLGLAVLVVAAPAPAYVVEAVTAISADEGDDRTRLENAIQAAMDDVAAHAIAFTPTVVVLLDARLIGDRIFLFVLLADREGERAVKVLLEERSAR
jgi:RNA polymerase sigma factor (sigma-70 family)